MCSMCTVVLVWSTTDKSFWAVPKKGCRKVVSHLGGDTESGQRLVIFNTPGATMLTRLWSAHFNQVLGPLQEICEPLAFARELHLTPCLCASALYSFMITCVSSLYTATVRDAVRPLCHALKCASVKSNMSILEWQQKVMP